MAYWNSINPDTLKTLLGLRDAGLLRNFYLAGGTGLALQVGHRVSVDLDLFTAEPSTEIPTEDIYAQCAKYFKHAGVEIKLQSSDQLWLVINGVEVTFLAYPYGHKYPLLKEDGIPLADARDIAFQKALAIGRRNHARDYVDLAWMLRKGSLTLDDIIKGASELFNAKEEGVFSPRLFLQQLVYTNALPDREAALNQLHTYESFDSIAKELMAAVYERSQHLLRGAPAQTNKSSPSPSPGPKSRIIAPSSRRACGPHCYNAKSKTCRCSCGGKNHGKGRR